MKSRVPTAAPLKDSRGRRPSRGSGYGAAAADALAGLVAGIAVGILLVTTIPSDPNAGFANLALILLGIVVVVLTTAGGAAVGAYMTLRWKRYARARATGVVMLMLFLALATSLGIYGAEGFIMAMIPAQIALALVARFIVLNYRSSDRHRWIAIAVLADFWTAIPVSYLVSPRRLEAQQQLAELRSVSFELYRPTYVPEGYEFAGAAVTDAELPGAPYVEMDYESSSSSFGIDQFPAWERFDPPTDCGPSNPNKAASFAGARYPCRKVFTTDAGVPVYWERGNTPSGFAPAGTIYLRLGNTMVTLLVSPGVSRAQIMEVVNSLEPVSPSEL